MHIELGREFVGEGAYMGNRYTDLGRVYDIQNITRGGCDSIARKKSSPVRSTLLPVHEMDRFSILHSEFNHTCSFRSLSFLRLA